MTKTKKWNKPKGKATWKQLHGFVKEEKDTSKLYDSLGYHEQATQERSHARFFKKQMKLKRVKNI